MHVTKRTSNALWAVTGNARQLSVPVTASATSTGAVGSAATTRPLRVAVDGPPAAGQTMLADELAVVLRAQGREVIRATIEGFLFPRAQRYRRGEYSHEGCYFDSHDHDAMRRGSARSAGSGRRRFPRAFYLQVSCPTAASPAT